MGDTWTLIVPIKRFAWAKSRMAVEPSLREDLVLAMLDDTLRAVSGCARVARTVVVAGDPAPERVDLHGAEWLHDSHSTDLNHAIVRGIDLLRLHGPVGVLPADLPCVSSRALSRVLRRAKRHSRAFVADAAGQGTTLLTARDAGSLLPLYGAVSARAHAAAGFARLRAPLALRLDVDTVADLQTALRHSPGERSALAGRRALSSITGSAGVPNAQPLIQHLSMKGTS